MKKHKNLINGMTVDELLAFHRETFGDTRMEETNDEALTAAPAAVAESAVLPTDFESIDDEALTEMLEKLTAEFDTAYGEGSRDIAALTALADDIDKVRVEQTTRAQAAAEADAAAEALAARVRPAIDAAEAVEEFAAEGEAGEQEAVAEQAEPAVAEVSAEPIVADELVEPELGANTAAPAAVTASARRAPADAVARRAPRPAPARSQPRSLVAGAANAPRPSLVAALDFATSSHPDVRPDQEVTLVQLAASFNERAGSMPIGKNRPRIGRLNMPFAPEQTLTSDAKHNAAVLHASVDRPITAEALVAAGGWCAPSTPVFEQFDLGPDADNLFDVPTFGGDVRAGILFPSSFAIGDADDAYWSWSETADINAVSGVAFTGSITANVATLNFADDHGLEVGSSIRISGATASGMPDGDYVVLTVPDADTVTVSTPTVATDAAISGTGTPFKHCMRIPCPTWTEARMGADGLCVTHGNLSNEAWPELTADFLRVALGSHRRYMSSRRIARVVNDMVTVSPTDPASDVAADIFQIIELQATDMRSQYRVSPSRTIEALIPEWYLPVMRANYAKREGISEWQAVADSQINAWLAVRGIKAQYTPDWQPLYSGTPAVAYPTTITIAMWFAGSYFSLNGGRIDLGVQRDPDLNQYNDYTAAWFEEFWTIARRGPQGRKFAYTLTGKIDGDPVATS